MLRRALKSSSGPHGGYYQLFDVPDQNSTKANSLAERGHPGGEITRGYPQRRDLKKKKNVVIGAII